MIFRKKAFIFLTFSVLAILFSTCILDSHHTLSTNGLEIAFTGDGQMQTLIDKKNSHDYAFATGDSPILSIRVGGEWEQPQKCTYNKEDRILGFQFPRNDVIVEVLVEEKGNYITLELITLRNQDSIELVVWGPYKTIINETIGETIGVVRNRKFAIGIQGLNPRTLGGYPSSEDDNTPSYNIFSTTSLVDIADSIKILYRGHTALPRAYGSSLQAYTRNRSQTRQVSTMNHEQYMAPAFEDEGLIGSKIALFGCKPEQVLEVIEEIEIHEGLPHPLLDGVWAKRAKSATAAYLIQNFSLENIDIAIALTKKAGLSYLYHFDPFISWGHFDLRKDAFPDNWESMRICVEMAERQGIKLGVHTLSNFIQTNDLYVTPVPDQRLAKVGSAVLTESINEIQKAIPIDNPSFFSQMKNNNLHSAMLGEELIRYEKVSENAPWVLLNCERGAFKTVASSHNEGIEISKLADHSYKTFLTNTNLSMEMARRIADLFNKTGLKQISFDGLEGNHSTGMGAYGELLFVKAWYDALKPEIKDNYIMDASRPGHYFWHMFTRMNWGEPWYAGFRESQTTYRLLNQDYFRRNYFPCMLGWFSMRETTSLEDIEWLLTRSAAFDAGYSLLTSPDIIQMNGYGSEILEKIKQWEKARMNNAFSDDQKRRMEKIEDEFSLVQVDENAWELIPFKVKRYEHENKVRQPGEPVWSTFTYENIYEKQPLSFILSTSENANVSKINIEINNFKTIVLEVVLKANQYLKYEGGDVMVLYDKTWNTIKDYPVVKQDLEIGKGISQLKVGCKFTGSETASLKLEIKTKGPPEPIGP
jgi:hypothetical protein